MDCFLGLDNGGSVTKAALFDSKGKELGVGSVNIAMKYPSPGFTERDIDMLWEANMEAIRIVLKKSGVNPEDIKGISVTGYGNGMIMIDEEGNALYDAIISTDSRAQDIVDGWYADGTFEKLFGYTKQSIWAAQPVSLLSWFKEHDPEVVKRTRWVLMVKDYIRYKLTGEVFAELSDYSGTNSVDLTTGTYNEEIFELLGLSDCMDKFPPLVLATDLCGSVTAEVAQQTGLKESTPVSGGLFDIHASCYASGITSEGMLSCVAGTWTINQMLSRTPSENIDIFMNSRSPIDGLTLVTEASPTSASNLEWFIKENMGLRKQEILGKGEDFYKYCEEQMRSVTEDSELLFLPFLYGCNVKGNMKAAFWGLESWHEQRHMLKAIHEGILFSTRMHVERLCEGGKKPTFCRLAGGPARSKYWVELYANVLQIPVEVVTVSEMGALGAAMTAAVATGYYPNMREAAQSMVTTGALIEPDSSIASTLDASYNRYVRLINACSDR